MKLPNEYVLYGDNKKNWKVWVAIMRAHLRISYNYELAKRLKESLYNNGKNSSCQLKGEAEGK